MPIRWAGLQNADRRALLLGQPVRQHRTGGAAADDDVIELLARSLADRHALPPAVCHLGV
jgi:hypothetical protein